MDQVKNVSNEEQHYQYTLIFVTLLVAIKTLKEIQ
jgi:hypothetical protein